MSEKYLKFNPGEYYDWEKEAVEFRFAVARGEATAPPAFPLRTPKPLTEEEIIRNNMKWNRYDPLYVDPEFARAHGHPSCPAYPGTMHFGGGGGVPGFPQNIGDCFYYHNDGSEIRYERNIYAGDMAASSEVTVDFHEDTEPDADIRRWFMGAETKSYDADGKLLATQKGNTRDCYRKLAEGTPRSYSEQIAEWVDYFPPGRYNTDEDYQLCKSIWDQEVIAGDNTPFWEDVVVGAELPKTCSDGPVTFMHMIYWHSMEDKSLFTREELLDPGFMATYYRDRYGCYYDDTALHFTGRNIDGSRGVWFNGTGGSIVARTVTNWMGYRGRVSMYSWRLLPFFMEMRTYKPGEEMFNKVPGMEGRYCNRHGAEGDIVIGRAVITGKYVNEKGEHCVEIACWGEDPVGDILTACPMEVVLPSRNG